RPARRLQYMCPGVGDVFDVYVAVSVRDVHRDGHIPRHLQVRDDRDPLHATGQVVAAGLAEPVRFLEQQIRIPPGDRVRRVLQVHHTWQTPRVFGTGQVV